MNMFKISAYKESTAIFVFFLFFSNSVSASILSGAELNLILRPSLVNGEAYEQGIKYNDFSTSHFAKGLLPNQPLTSDDFLTLMIWGNENSISYVTTNSIDVTKSIGGSSEPNSIEVDIDLTFGQFVSPVLNQYAYFIDIGKLSSGEYNLVVHQSESASTSFTVLPMPGAFWLFISGMLLVFRRIITGSKGSDSIDINYSDCHTGRGTRCISSPVRCEFR